MGDSDVFVGIDVSKANLDVGIIPESRQLSVANDKPGIDNLVCR